MRWLDASELRVGLGCMRLSTDEDRDEEVAVDTIVAAAEAGVTVFDTARAYGDNETMLRRALHGRTARIVTKGGMSRTGGAWIPDGRAKAIHADCEASLAALDGLEIDLYLIHAPDPRTPWRTSVRALARLVDDGLVRHVGVSNVNRSQLDEALDLAPIAAVEVALSPYDDRAIRHSPASPATVTRLPRSSRSPGCFSSRPQSWPPLELGGRRPRAPRLAPGGSCSTQPTRSSSTAHSADLARFARRSSRMTEMSYW